MWINYIANYPDTWYDNVWLASKCSLSMSSFGIHALGNVQKGCQLWMLHDAMQYGNDKVKYLNAFFVCCYSVRKIKSDSKSL